MICRTGLICVVLLGMAVSGCAPGSMVAHGPVPSGPLERQVEKQQLRITAMEQQLATMSVAQRQQDEHHANLMERLDEVLAEVAKIRADATNTRSNKLQNDVVMRQPRLGSVDSNFTQIATETQEQTPTAVYRRAFAAYTTGKHALAQQLFDTFATSFPDNDYVANARFWQGEACLAQGLYSEAQKAFAAVAEFDPHSPKVPFAQFKQALILARQGDKRAARAMLEDVKRDYPGTDAAEQAVATLNSERLN